MKQINDISLRCPCCNEIRKYGNLGHLKKWHSQHQSPWILTPIESAEQGFLQWACDKCIEDNKAIVGRPDKQNVIGITHPYFVYYDQERTCSTCGINFIFSKEEQQYWYEELNFITWSEAKDCKDCRKAKREPKQRNTKISTLIKNLEPSDLNQIEELVGLYLEINKVEKAKYFLAIGKKNTKDNINNETNERLDRLKEKITTHNNGYTQCGG